MLLRELTSDIMPLRAAPLAGGVVLVATTGPDDVLPGFTTWQPPFGTVSVEGDTGPFRIAAMRLPPDDADDGWDRFSLIDPDDLASELDLASRRRLLGFLLGFCRSAFALANDPDFALTCVRLAQTCAETLETIEPVAQATPFWIVLPGPGVVADATYYILNSSGVRLSTAPRLPGVAARLIEPLADGDLLLAFGNVPTLAVARRNAAPLPEMLSPGPHDRAFAALRAPIIQAIARAGGPAAAWLRERQFLQPAAPRGLDDPAACLSAVLEAALPDGENGLFLRGWLRDPAGLISSFEVRTPLGNAVFGLQDTYRYPRLDLAGRFAKSPFRETNPLAGFVAHVPDPAAGLCLQPVLALRLRSGKSLELRAAARHLPAATARDAVLSAVPPEVVTPRILDGCLAPAASALHRQALAVDRTPEIVQIGPRDPRPAVSILVPIYRNLEFLRFQIAAFAADAECRRAELIYVLDSPEQRAETEHLLRGLHALHELSLTLLVMPHNLGYAAANNAAASVARGGTLLLLNSDVVPAQPGWLGSMRKALAAPGVAAAGPKLLFDDGSIQHAGLFFSRDADGEWFNAHYHKGMPRAWPAAQRRRRVPGVTGAALLVRRTAFEAVGGVCEDYIVGDYEDSDFCLRLRAVGSGIVYVPEAELFHFERRSIRLHTGYRDTLACQYNRRLHHRRWDAEIATLMDRREFRSAA